MAPTDPRDAALIDTAASVIGRLVVAHAHADHPEISQQVMRLLNAVAKYNAALAERASDRPLRQAIERLNGFLA